MQIIKAIEEFRAALLMFRKDIRSFQINLLPKELNMQSVKRYSIVIV